MRTRLCALALTLVLPACESGTRTADDEPATVTFSDSAGIAIVTNTGPRWGGDEGWRVPDTPLLSLGDAESSSNEAFDQIGHVAQLDDGRIVVLDQRARVMSYFDADGGFLRTFGSAGEGPGEFNGFELLGLRADTIWIADERQRRVTAVTGSGDLGEVVTVDVDNMRNGVVGLLPDGSWIVATDLLFSGPPPEMNGLMRFEAAYLRGDLQGAPVDTILRAPGNEAIVRSTSATVEIMGPLLHREVSHAIWNGQLAQSSQETAEIGVYDPDGTRRRLIRLPDEDLLIDEQAYAELAEVRIAAVPEPARPGMRMVFEEMPRPDRRAPFTTFLTDSEGHLWVRDFSYAPESHDWQVLDPDGALLGTVTVPDGFRPTQILDDRMAGVYTDEFDVQYARLYKLERF